MQRGGGQVQLLAGEVAGARGGRVGEPYRERAEVHRAAVVRVDQGVQRLLAALVEVRHARHGEVQQGGGEGVGPGVRGEGVHPALDPGEQPGVAVDGAGPGLQGLLVAGGWGGPGGVQLGLADGLEQGGDQPVRGDRPGGDQGVPEQPVGVPVEPGCGRPGGGGPGGGLGGPGLGLFGEDGEPGAGVGAALGVVGGEHRHGVRPVAFLPAAPGVELGRVQPRPGGLAADLVEPGQRVPAVEGGVLDALGGHRGRGLGEAHAELVVVRPAPELAERQRGHQAVGRVGGAVQGRPQVPVRRGFSGPRVRPVGRIAGE